MNKMLKLRYFLKEPVVLLKILMLAQVIILEENKYQDAEAISHPEVTKDVPEDNEVPFQDIYMGETHRRHPSMVGQ